MNTQITTKEFPAFKICTEPAGALAIPYKFQSLTWTKEVMEDEYVQGQIQGWREKEEENRRIALMVKDPEYKKLFDLGLDNIDENDDSWDRKYDEELEAFDCSKVTKISKLQRQVLEYAYDHKDKYLCPRWELYKELTGRYLSSGDPTIPAMHPFPDIIVAEVMLLVNPELKNYLMQDIRYADNTYTRWDIERASLFDAPPDITNSAMASASRCLKRLNERNLLLVERLGGNIAYEEALEEAIKKYEFEKKYGVALRTPYQYFLNTHLSGIHLANTYFDHGGKVGRRFTHITLSRFGSKLVEYWRNQK